MFLFLVSTVACTKAEELRKVITAHFGSGQPPASRRPRVSHDPVGTCADDALSALLLNLYHRCGK